MKELVPFLLQGLLVGIDEFYFHQRRTLNRWERWGHPIDTAFFFFCFVYLAVMPPEPRHLGVYAGLSILSCLLVTKDEWQHRELCSGLENWLHALSFMLHPVVLIWTGFLWWTQADAFPFVVMVTMVGTLTFSVYLMVFWNLIKAPAKQGSKDDR